jgi:hypothetical protein
MEKENRKRVHYYNEYQRPTGRAVDRTEIVTYRKGMIPNKLVIMQRKKPSYISYDTMPLSKNPRKVILYRSGGDIGSLMIFYYNDRPNWFDIAFSGRFVGIPLEHVKDLLKAARRYLKEASA